MVLYQQAAPTPKHHKKQKAQTVQPQPSDPPQQIDNPVATSIGFLLVFLWFIAFLVGIPLLIWAFWMFVFKSIGKAFRKGQLEADRANHHPVP